MDWAGSIDDKRSTTSYCTFVQENLVIWRSKKQNVVGTSAEALEHMHKTYARDRG